MGAQWTKRETWKVAMGSKWATCFLVITLLPFVLAGCGNEVDSLAELDRKSEKLPSLDSFPAGHEVSGRVRFAGTPPEPTVVRMISDAACHVSGSGPREAEDVEIGPDGGVANVFVWISDFPDRYAPPDEEVLLDQEGCEYRPRVFGIMVGQVLRIRNSDATLHNVRLDAEDNREFNLGQPRKGMETTKSFANEEVMVNFECDVHPWMDAWGGVLSHPLYGVTNERGEFVIDGVPDGSWTLSWWHERLGTGRLPITVAGDELELDPIVIESNVE